MNSKVVKILRKFAEIEKLDYTGVKNHFQSRGLAEQKAHLIMMRQVIREKGGDNKMAEQKICDRPHKVIIQNNEDYLPLEVKQPDGSKVHYDLCGQCALDFKAFMNASPTPPPSQPEAQQTPAEPASETPPAQPAADAPAQPGQ